MRPSSSIVDPFARSFPQSQTNTSKPFTDHDPRPSPKFRDVGVLRRFGTLASSGLRELHSRPTIRSESTHKTPFGSARCQGAATVWDRGTILSPEPFVNIRRSLCATMRSVPHQNSKAFPDKPPMAILRFRKFVYLRRSGESTETPETTFPVIKCAGNAAAFKISSHVARHGSPAPLVSMARAGID